MSIRLHHCHHVPLFWQLYRKSKWLNLWSPLHSHSTVANPAAG